MMALHKAAAMLLALAACAAGPALAQISSEGGPIYINSERTESLERDRKVLLIGNVDIRQGDARLRADTVTIFFTGRQGDTADSIVGGFGQIERIHATGSVYYVTPELRAKGDQGIYELANDTITMTGNVALMRDRDVAEGERLRMEIANRRTTLEGGSGRARMVIDPTTTQANP